MSATDSDRRALAIAGREIQRQELDLEGLVVLTEAASGPYLATPVLAALARARHVDALARDSAWGTADAVERDTMALAASAGVADRITIVRSISPHIAAAADIVTNSGHLRPIDARMVGWLRPTAVVPLMFEPWEARDEDIDLAACHARGIAVLGTNEHHPRCSMGPWVAALAVRMLFELGSAIVRERILVLGAQPLIGGSIAAALRGLGADVRVFGAADEAPAAGAAPFADLAEAALVGIDAVVVAEHRLRSTLVGPGAPVDPRVLRQASPGVRVLAVTGGVDGGALAAQGIPLLPVPEALRPAGTMHLNPGLLGPGPVLELYAAGLAVAGAMARVRLAGGSVDEARRAALACSPALDFGAGNGGMPDGS